MSELPSTIYVTTEPEMMFGLTGSEIMILLVIAFTASTVGTIILWALLPFLGFKLLAVDLIISFILFSVIRYGIVSNKRNRPDGYYLQMMAIARTKANLLPVAGLILREGYWDHFRHQGED